jgi:hypothetical protein
MNNKYLRKIKLFFQFGNRTFNDYRMFIEKAKTNGFKFVPLVYFTKPSGPTDKIIGMRHDVDSELNHALKIAKIEFDAGIKATYFVLHTAKYFCDDIATGKLKADLVEKLLYLQNTLGHEIGLHVDMMPIEIVYKKNPDTYVNDLIAKLENQGIRIHGIAPHGNLFQHIYRKPFLKKDQEHINNIFANPYKQFDVKQWNLEYEAYSLNHDTYFSDARFVNAKRWDFSCIDDNFYKNNSRTIILTHTIHWAPGKLYYFTVNFMITIGYFLNYAKEYLLYRKSK